MTTEDKIREVFSRKLSCLLKEKNCTQLDLAHFMNVSNTTVNNWVNGYKMPRMDKIDRICVFFGINRKDLLTDSAPPTSKPTYPNVTPATYRKFKVIGNIACGNPIEAIENASECEYVETNLNIHADYVLRAQGDSMINARIFNGDFVFIREQPEVENGEIAAVLMDGEVTLKRFYRYDEYIELRAENPMYKPIIIHESDFDTIKVIGKAVACQFFVI